MLNQSQKICDSILELSKNDYESYVSIINELNLALASDSISVTSDCFLKALSDLMKSGRLRVCTYDKEMNEFVEVSGLVEEHDLHDLWFVASNVGQSTSLPNG